MTNKKTLTVLNVERASFTNSVGLMCTIIGALYISFYTFYEAYKAVYFLIPIEIVFTLGFLFLRKKKQTLYKTTLLINIYIATLLFTLFMGYESDLYYLFLSGTVLPFILFTHDKPLRTKAFVFLNLLSFSIFYFPESYFDLKVIPKELLGLTAKLTPWTFLLFIVLPVFKLYKISVDLILKVIKDSDELVIAMEQVETNADLIEAIINSSRHSSIFAVDKDLNILKHNKAFSSWINQIHDKEVKEGMNYLDLLPKHKAMLYKPLFKRALKGDSFSKKIINKIGDEEIHIEMTFTPLIHNSEVRGVSVFSKDVSDSIKLEYAIQEKRVTEKSLQFRTDFLAQMSHEIRTPLNGIVGMTDLINDSDNLTEKERDHLKVITESGNELMHIINSVLDLSKLEAGQVKISPSFRETNKLLQHSKDLFETKAKEKGLNLTVEYAKDLPPAVKVDAVRIHQILNNLTSNAIKFTKTGEIILRLSCTNSDETSTDLKFEVIDTGSGINQADQKRLFNKYAQLNANTARKADGTNMGTGLGLTISQELVELMNGFIGVESKPQYGSNFFFTLPKVDVGEINEGVESVKNTKEFNGFDKHVLIVEDKKVNQKVAQMVLKSLGCTSEIAENGEECLMLYMKNQDKFDLILMDIQMPIMDGLTATSELKRNFKNVPPVVALSANNMEGDESKYLSYGLDGYISKPINAKILKENLAKYFK